MIELLLLAGSFVFVWLGSWLVLLALLLVAQPLLRRALLRLDPREASALLLLCFALPPLLGLLTALLLYLPGVEALLVDAHCHDDCAPHVPLLGSVPLGVAGLLSFAVVTLRVFRRVRDNVVLARRLGSQFDALAVSEAGWQLLDQEQPLVFTLGWWRARAYLTSGLRRRCEPWQLDVMLAHEQTHADRHDNLRLLWARACLLPLPARLAERLYADLHLLTEAACDLGAALQHGALAVAEALLHVQKLVPAVYQRHQVLAFTGAEVAMRIRLLLDERQRPHWRWLPALSLCVALLLCVVVVEPLHHWMEVLWSRG